jgi:hypothetical protein
MATPAPYYPNYAYVGPPAVYNGTGKNGGDSGMIFQFYSSFVQSLFFSMFFSFLEKCYIRILNGIFFKKKIYLKKLKLY